MEELYAAKYNIYWYLSFLAPAAIMLFTTFWNRKWILVFGIVISLFATCLLRAAAVSEKWHIRNKIAATPEEKAYAQADGANLLFETVFFAPFQSVLSTAIWGVLGWSFWRSVKTRQRKTAAAIGEDRNPFSGTMSIGRHP